MTEWISEVSKSDLSRVGEKAALLGELTKFGFPIPKAFIISFDEFVEARSRLQPEIEAAISSSDASDFNSIIHASNRIKQLFEEYRFDNFFEKEIADSYSKLHIDKTDYGNVDPKAFNFIKAGRDLPFVSVRVSTNSSTPKHYSTFLNVKSSTNVISSIKKAWASIYSPYSILFRKITNSPFPKAAIIVQLMINSSKSGDLFSLNPINRDRTQFIIQARWGLSLKSSLGSSIFICDKSTSEIIKSYNHIPKVYHTKDSQSGVTALRTLEDEFKSIPLITNKEIELLSRISSDVEARMGYPVHMEWSIEKRKFNILQVSPISNFFKSKPTENTYETQFTELVGKGIPSTAGFVSGRLVFINSTSDFGKFNRGDILVADSFNGHLLPLLIKAGGIVFQNEDLSSFGSIIAKDFGKPCIVKASLQIENDLEQVELNSASGMIFSPELTPQTIPVQEDEAPTNSDNSDNSDLNILLDEFDRLEKELTSMNLKYASERQSGIKLSERNTKIAKLISDLEWEVREIKEKINQHLP